MKREVHRSGRNSSLSRRYCNQKDLRQEMASSSGALREQVLIGSQQVEANESCGVFTGKSDFSLFVLLFETRSQKVALVNFELEMIPLPQFSLPVIGSQGEQPCPIAFPTNTP